MKVTELRSMLKKNSLVFFTYKKLTDSLYRSSMIDYMLTKQVKSKEKIKKEVNLIKNYWKCDPMTYYRYRLYEKNLTDDELLDYIPPYYFYNYYVPSIYADAQVRKAASKIQMSDYLAEKKISSPAAVAKVMNGKIHCDGSTVGYNSFIEKLRDSGFQKFFMKPDTGKGGKGIYRIEKIGREFFINNEFLGYKLFGEICSNQNYIIQGGIIQRDDMRAVYPGSVNTLRVITQNFNGIPEISVVAFRMGRNGTFVDNSASGGISLKVDTETGRIDRLAIDVDNNKAFEKHPDTGFKFDGFVINDWSTIKSSILDFAAKASDFPDVGWDIAIQEDKAIVIELNLNYGIDMQAVVGGLRRRLHIEPFAAPKKVKIA